MSAPVRAGSLAAEVFARAGVRYVFGIPGGHIYPMMEGCAERGIGFVGVRHEMTAAFAAEGWALTTGQLGVCTGTAGPGVTNMVTGMGNAASGGYPVLYFGGRARVSEFDRNELQDFPQLPIVVHLCKYARSVADPSRLPEYTAQAITQATNGRPGPVYVEMPRDLMDGLIDPDTVPISQTPFAHATPQASTSDIEKASTLIRAAQRPILIVGGGAWWSQAQDALAQFVEITDIPFFTRNAARGILPDSHPLYMNVGYNHPVLLHALQQCDLAIVVGTRPGFTLSRQAFPAGLNMIRIDIDAAEATNQLDVTLPVIGDASAVLTQLAATLAGTMDEGRKQNVTWAQSVKNVCHQVSSSFVPALTSDQYPIHPARLMAEIASRIDQDTIVVMDGGDSAIWGASFLPATGPGQMLGISNNSFGPLGVGMGYSIAAALAHPDKKVIHLTGDGAFGYGAMEYETCLRFGLNITTVILNDKMWGMIKRSEASHTGASDFVGLDLGLTRYEKVVEALGGYGEFVDQPGDIGPAIDRALASGKPACVNVMTDPNIGPPSA